MKRRNFIILGTAGIAALSIPTAYYFLGDTEYDPGLADPRSLSMIWDTETITSAGNTYRLQTPSENNVRALVKKIAADVGPSNPEERIKKEFETGNTVLVDGWILSVTEARQCALFSTIEPQ